MTWSPDAAWPARWCQDRPRYPSTPANATAPQPKTGPTASTNPLKHHRYPDHRRVRAERVAITPDGTTAYVTNENDSTVSVINLAPANAAGTVQFNDATTNLGGPVAVLGGIAVGPVITLAPGQHQVTAVFTPTDPTKFQPSTSNTVTFRF